MVAIIGGEPHRFRPLIDLYREAGVRSGHKPEQLKVGLHMIGFVGDTTKEAADVFSPATPTPSRKLARNAAGRQLLERNSTLCADPRARC